MMNFGFRRLRLVNPYDVALQGARAAVGAEELLASAEEFKIVADAIADCKLVVGTTAVRHRELQHPLRRLDQDAARLINDELRTAQVALMFGSEKYGLSTEDLSHCHWLLHIPTQEPQISMNLGQAVAVCLYELIRGEVSSKAAFNTLVDESDNEPATAGEMERITTVLFEILRVSGYVKPGTEVWSDEKVRRMVRHLNIRSADVAFWLGVLRQALWKMKNGQH
jgi:tRNA/rRNA methyltransferase